eukprot:COSAG01_NODE_7066_length_3369_cov_5.472171_5_plen_144_part_00
MGACTSSPRKKAILQKYKIKPTETKVNLWGRLKDPLEVVAPALASLTNLKTLCLGDNQIVEVRGGFFCLGFFGLGLRRWTYTTSSSDDDSVSEASTSYTTSRGFLGFPASPLDDALVHHQRHHVRLLLTRVLRLQHACSYHQT